jgi:hypothetical protein
VVRLRGAGASVSAPTASGGADPGGHSGCGAGRDHAVRSSERSIRAAGTDDRANGAHPHDSASLVEGTGEDRGDDRAEGFTVPDRLSLAHGVTFGLTITFGVPHGVTFGFSVTFGLTESIGARSRQQFKDGS